MRRIPPSHTPAHTPVAYPIDRYTFGKEFWQAAIYYWRWAPHILFVVKVFCMALGFGPSDWRSEVV